MPLTKATQNVIEGIVSTGSTGVSAGSFQVGQQYKITSLGTTTQLQWNTIAGTTGQTYVVGSLFTAATIGTGSGNGAAAVARTLADRFADVINVKDFGAVGDGVTNDSAAFDAAIASPTLGPVFVPKGDYNAGFKNWQERGVISLSDGASDNVWLLSRKMTGNQNIGSGTFRGFSPAAYMQDLEEDCEVIGGEFMIASRVRHRFLGGTTTRGGRTAFLSQMEKLGVTASDNQNRNYVSSAAFITVSSDDGGTDTISNSTAKGGHFAGSWAVYLRPQGKNLRNVCGGEINIFGESGASTRYQSGISIACAYAQRGTESDAALSISGLSNATTHVGYGAGILFSSTNGRHPFSSTSTIILAKNGPNDISGPPSVFRGIDFSQYNITDSIIKGAQSDLTESSLTIGDNGDGTNGVSYIYAGSKSTNATLRIRPKGNGVVSIQSSDGLTDLARFDANINVCTMQNTRPAADATILLGDASRRWSQVYAASGTINTSDAREKTFFQIEDAEKLAALEIKQNLRKFKFNSAIEEKGDNARIHFGASAQQVGDIMKSHNLDPNKYGFYCYDEWNEIEEQKDNEGNVIEPYRASGNRYGVRYDELLSFIISAL